MQFKNDLQIIRQEKKKEYGQYKKLEDLSRREEQKKAKKELLQVFGKIDQELETFKQNFFTHYAGNYYVEKIEHKQRQIANLVVASGNVGIHQNYIESLKVCNNYLQNLLEQISQPAKECYTHFVLPLIDYFWNIKFTLELEIIQESFPPGKILAFDHFQRLNKPIHAQPKKFEENLLTYQQNGNNIDLPRELWGLLLINVIQYSPPLELIQTICRWRLINTQTCHLINLISYSDFFKVIKEKFMEGMSTLNYKGLSANHQVATLNCKKLIEITKKGLVSQVAWPLKLVSQAPALWKEIKLEYFFKTSRLIWVEGRNHKFLANTAPETWGAGLRFAALKPGLAAQPQDLEQLQSILIHLDTEAREKYLTEIITDETLSFFFGRWPANALNLLCAPPLTANIISELIQSLLQKPIFQKLIKEAYYIRDWVKILNKIDQGNMSVAKKLIDSFIERFDCYHFGYCLIQENVSIPFLKNFLRFLLDTNQILEYEKDYSKLEIILNLYFSILRETSAPELFDNLLDYNFSLPNYFIEKLCQLPKETYAKILQKHLEAILAKCELNSLDLPRIINYINSNEFDFFINHPQAIIFLSNQLGANDLEPKIFLKIINFLAELSPENYEDILRRMNTEQSKKWDVNQRKFYNTISQSNNIFNLLLAAGDCLKSSFFSTFYLISLTALDKEKEIEKINFIDCLYAIDPTIFNYFNDKDNLPTFIEPHSQMKSAMLIAQVKNYHHFCSLSLNLMEKNNEKIYKFSFFQSDMYVWAVKQAAAIELEQALWSNDFSSLDQCPYEVKEAIKNGFLGKIFNYALRHNIGNSNDKDQNLARSANNNWS